MCTLFTYAIKAKLYYIDISALSDMTFSLATDTQNAACSLSDSVDVTLFSSHLSEQHFCLCACDYVCIQE